MSKIIELIITFVVYFFVGIAAALPLTIFYTRKMDKLIANYFRSIDEIFAARDESLDESHARSQSQDEVSAQVDEIHEDIDEIDKSFDEMHESLDRISESIDRMNESFDRMNESMDRTIEFKRLMRDYSNYKIKMIEARENFREPEFSDEKNIH